MPIECKNWYSKFLSGGDVRHYEIAWISVMQVCMCPWTRQCTRPGAVFSYQAVMNKCFPLNPKKFWRRSVLLFSRKTQKPSTLTHSYSKNWRHRAEGYANQ